MLKRFFPILDWLPLYKKRYLQNDIIAGITIGIMLIPQGMAYAMIAGLPPVYGLYAALIPQVVYAISGTSRQLAVGPVAMDSILVASGLGALSISGINEYISIAIFLAMYIGIIQLSLGILRMGFLVNFLSRPVISGFTSAAAIIIGLSQLKHLLGIDTGKTNKIHLLLNNVIENIPEINLYTLGIGIVAIIMIKLFKKVNKKIPAAIVIVILGIVTIYYSEWYLHGVKIIGEIPKGLPHFSVPKINGSMITQITPIAITLALIGFMEAISIAKAIEEKKSDYEVKPNQELIALGLTNFIGAFFQSHPVTGSFSRSAVNNQSGAKTTISLLVSALIILLVLLFMTPLFYYLPNTILAAIIMVAVFGLIDIKYPIHLFKKGKDEFILLLLTFVITLTIGIIQGIVIGVLASLIIMVYRTSRPHIAILGRIKGTNYFKNINRFGSDIEDRDDLLILRFDSQLFFGNKDYFKKELLKNISTKKNTIKAVILNAEAINYVDSSAMFMLQQLISDLKKQGVLFMITGAIGPTRDIFFKNDFIHLLGKENLFVRTYEAVDHYDGFKTKTQIQEKIAQQSK